MTATTSLSDPSSEQEASRALQRDPSDMALGHTTATTDSNLRLRPLDHTASSSGPLVFLPVCVLISVVGRVGRVLGPVCIHLASHKALSPERHKSQLCYVPVGGQEPRAAELGHWYSPSQPLPTTSQRLSPAGSNPVRVAQGPRLGPELEGALLPQGLSPTPCGALQGACPRPQGSSISQAL